LSDGSSLAIIDQFYNIWAGPFGDIQFDQIENFQFQNAANTDWTPADIEQMAIAAQLAAPGGAAYGFWNGAYFDPGPGTGGRLMVGEGGTNTYAFGLGYGDDTVEDSGGGEVLFNADVDPADVTFLRGASNDLTIMLSDGSELDLENEFSYVPVYTSNTASPRRPQDSVPAYPLRLGWMRLSLIGIHQLRMTYAPLVV
jgi:hypothetical protein